MANILFTLFIIIMIYFNGDFNRFDSIGIIPNTQAETKSVQTGLEAPPALPWWAEFVGR